MSFKIVLLNCGCRKEASQLENGVDKEKSFRKLQKPVLNTGGFGVEVLASGQVFVSLYIQERRIFYIFDKCVSLRTR